MLNGEAGTDILMGGTGNDTLDGGDGYDQLKGGADNDFIYASSDQALNPPTNVNYTKPVFDAAYPIHIATGFNWLAESNGNLNINGSYNFIADYARNRIEETTGNQIDGGTGDDFIAAGTGADYVHGGADKDLVHAANDATYSNISERKAA